MNGMRLDETFNGESANFETRELAWELQQERPDQRRVKFLIDHADLRTALAMAQISEETLGKNPALKPLQLQRHLHPRPEM